jgi:hypothetical protein
MQAESERDPISALKDGHLMIHCFRMELVQDSSDQPARYAGSGYIEQVDHSAIVFTMYSTETTNAGPFSLSHWAGAQSGTIFRDDESYTLNATVIGEVRGEPKGLPIYLCTGITPSPAFLGISIFWNGKELLKTNRIG